MASKPTLPTAQRQQAPPPAPAPRGPNRSTKASQKLKVLPEEPEQIPTPANAKTLKSEKGTGEDDDDDDSDDSEPEEEEEEDVQVYKQLAQIPAGSARKDAMRLTRKEKAKLPRLTAYCTATSYRLPALLEHLQSRRSSHLTAPIQFDECLYTPYSFPVSPDPPSSSSGSNSPQPSTYHATHSTSFRSRGGSSLNPNNERPSSSTSIGKLVDIDEEATAAIVAVGEDGGGLGLTTGEGGAAAVKEKKKKKPRFAVESEMSGDEGPAPEGGKSFDGSVSGAGNGYGGTPGKRTKADVFIFEFGSVVTWGMTLEQEKRFLSTLKRFEVERLSSDDIEQEELNYYYANYSRIYNDVIALKKGSSYMTKLSLSHAIAQSVKLSFFESAVSNTIDETKDIPTGISQTGKIGLPRVEIMKQIGRLFLLRVNISLVGSMIDSPELFWSFPDLEPLYGAFKLYLEVPQRLKVINGRVEVLQDMLRLLKESVNSSHGEGLELIVIWLIVLEVVLGLITIAVDLFA